MTGRRLVIYILTEPLGAAGDMQAYEGATKVYFLRPFFPPDDSNFN